jgi:hypothetical protein
MKQDNEIIWKMFRATPLEYIFSSPLFQIISIGISGVC